MSESGGAGGPSPTVVDARGLRCPLPVIALARAAAAAPAGGLVAVRWTDPAARHDIPAWARMRGHAVVSTEQDGPPGPPGTDVTQEATRPAWVTTVRLR